MSTSDEDGMDFRAHFDASQFRRECWSELKKLTARLERVASRGGATEELRQEVEEVLAILRQTERYACYPGPAACVSLTRGLARGAWKGVAWQAARLARQLISDAYRRRDVSEIVTDESQVHDAERESARPRVRHETRPYFEVLIVDDLGQDEAREVRRRLLDMRRDDDRFVYDVVLVGSVEDALIAVQFNHNIQTCILRYSFPTASATPLPQLRDFLASVDLRPLLGCSESQRSALLARALKMLRPELDLFLSTDEPVEHIAGATDADFRRVFYNQEDYLELHLSILKGITERYETPFFSALKQYSQKPTGVFHALPISRGKSITRSNWIQDMGRFYGTNIFLAETSATSGGLDSLLQPHGPLKRAQELAARAFGARRTFFVTNGTSAANKIVMQALVRPGDIVLVSHDCHKSHHYALVLAGASPVYMDPYPLHDFTMYGAVPLREIKRHLLELRAAGKLDAVRMVLLTNCTFDGVVYNPYRVMREILAIKPDMIFVWDEAWFAFARCLTLYRQRTAMDSSKRLRADLHSDAYREEYDRWRAEFDTLDPDAEATWLDRELLPDPDKVRIRAYATQSTHKTLTSLRQGSMIHVQDEDFARKAQGAFLEAYMTYTSTSPNYQILASLDVGRRQVELEGYELVRRSVELAMLLRERIQEHPVLRKHFRVLKARDLVPAAYRPSGLEEFYSPETGFQAMEKAWREDEFVLDPTRVTIFIGGTGIDGDTFKQMLMDRHDIQINKTSRNTLLFMLNIGTTRGSVAYLLKVLDQVAVDLVEKREHQDPMAERIQDARVFSLTVDLPPLPNFSRFHAAFAADGDGHTPEGDLRTAFFLSYDEASCEFVSMADAERVLADGGRELVSASFVTPYPPGFPILVPGQILSKEILAYMKALDVKEIHGFQAEYGFRFFTEAALARVRAARGIPGRTPSETRS